MEWILTDNEWILKDGFTTILTLSTYNSPETWSVIYPCLDNIMTAFHADSEEEAKLKAVLLLNNKCNEEIAKYMRLRDKLPSFLSNENVPVTVQIFRMMNEKGREE